MVATIAPDMSYSETRIDGSLVPETAKEGELTNTQWLRILAISNGAVFEQIKTMVNEEGYPLHDIREFVDEYGLNAFVAGHYHTWEELENNFSHEAVVAYIEYAGIDSLESLEDAYMGEFENEEEFAEYYFTGLQDLSGIYTAIDSGLVVDWEATWATNLSYDFAFQDGFVFNRNV